MIDDSNAVEVGALLGEALERDHHSYAIGGALAYGFYGVPRATHDVDINVFVEIAAIGAVIDTLAKAGVSINREQALAEAADQGMFSGRYAAMRIDVFIPSIPFSWEAARRRVRKTIAGRELWFLSAEALAVFKLLFFRGKDIVDLERLIGVQGHRLDHAYIRKQIVDLLGEDDIRVSKWDELLRTFMPQTPV